MAYLASIKPAEATYLQAAAPAERQTPEPRFSDLEWSIIRLARLDRMWTLRTPTRLSRFFRRLIGRNPIPDLLTLGWRRCGERPSSVGTSALRFRAMTLPNSSEPASALISTSCWSAPSGAPTATSFHSERRGSPDVFREKRVRPFSHWSGDCAHSA